MKKSLIAASLCAVSACTMEMPQTANQMRQVAGSSAIFVSKSAHLPQSRSVVASTLRTMNRNCFNRTVSSSSVYRAGPYGAQTISTTKTYSGTVRNSGNTTSLEVRLLTHGPKIGRLAEPEGGYVYFVADAQGAQGGGTDLTVRVLRTYGQEYLKTITNSVSTGRVTCPVPVQM